MKFEGLNININDVQKVELEILLEFDRICNKNNITYQLFAGSLLGAVRHKGFIPWDDDVDVCLMRDDYNRFLRACEKELDPKYFLQTYETNKEYIKQYAKLRKNNTTFLESELSDCKIHHGINIDIFPLDNVLPNTFIGELQRISLYFLGAMNMSKLRKFCLDNSSNLKKCILLCMHFISKLIPKNWMDKTQKSIACIFNNKNTTYVSHLTNGTSKSRYFNYMMDKKDFFNVVPFEFEGHYFNGPANYEIVLSRLFGDYNKFPPKNKQKPHHNVTEISFIKGVNSNAKEI